MSADVALVSISRSLLAVASFFAIAPLLLLLLLPLLLVLLLLLPNFVCRNQYTVFQKLANIICFLKEIYRPLAWRW